MEYAESNKYTPHSHRWIDTQNSCSPFHPRIESSRMHSPYSSRFKLLWKWRCSGCWANDTSGTVWWLLSQSSEIRWIFHFIDPKTFLSHFSLSSFKATHAAGHLCDGKRATQSLRRVIVSTFSTLSRRHQTPQKPSCDDRVFSRSTRVGEEWRRQFLFDVSRCSIGTRSTSVSGPAASWWKAGGWSVVHVSTAHSWCGAVDLHFILSACLMKRFGRASWNPWLISLAIDVTSQLGRHSSVTKFTRWLTLSPSEQQSSKYRARSTSLERNEEFRRLWILVFYLLRSPVYERFTKFVLL